MILDLKHKPRPDMRSMMNLLDTLDALGCDLGRPAIRKARKLAGRHEEIGTAARTDLDGAADVAAAAALDYADGKITADQARSAAVAATLAGDHSSALHEIYRKAQTRIASQAREELATLGDKWVTDIIRPVVNTLTARILADIPSTLVDTIRPGDPHAEAVLVGRTTAQLAHAQLRRVHSVANELRLLRCIPATSRERSCWEWDTSMGRRSRPDTTLAEWVHTAHQGSIPGIYTEAQAAAAEEDDPTTTVDPQARAVAQHNRLMSGAIRR